MSTINIWPRLGTTVTLASGYVVTAAGATSAWPNDEIFNLLAQFKLLTFDPTGLNPNPSPIPPVDTGGGLSCTSMALLALIPAILPGATCEVLGFYSANDGGGGTFYADVGSSSPVVAGMCVAALGGRWKRLCDPAYVHVKWFGAYGDNSHDDTAAFQLAMNTVAVSHGGTIYFDSAPAGYRITATLKCGQGSGANNGNSIKMIGGGPTGAITSTPTLYWDGASSTLPMIWCCGYDFSFHNFGIQVTSGRTLFSGIEIGNFAVSPIYFSSEARFEGITMYSDSASRGFLNGVTIGKQINQNGNLERCFFESCSFQGITNNAVWLGSGQPFNTSFIRCLFYALYNIPQGRALQCDTPSATITFTDSDFEGNLISIYLTRNANISIDGGQSELCKTLFYSYTPAGYIPGCLTVKALRMSNTNVTNAVPWVYMNGGGAVTFEGCTMSDTDQGYCEVNPETPVVSRGNMWPNTTFFKTRPPVTTEPTAGLWSFGDVVLDTSIAGGVAVSLPVRMGSYNVSYAGALSTISGAATSIAVTLPQSEYDTSYKVRLDVESITAGGVVGSLWASSKTATGFTINTGTAPGVGKDLVVRYTVYR